MAIYVNRILNMKQIKVIGFDMDHTLVRYHSDKFEELTFNVAIKKLLEDHKLPAEINNFLAISVKGILVLSINMSKI